MISATPLAPAAAIPYTTNAAGDLQPHLNYPEFLDRLLQFVLVDLDHGWSSGNAYHDAAGQPLPAYLNYAVADAQGRLGLSDDPNNAGAVYPAFHHAIDIRGLLRYWQHTGNAECLARARRVVVCCAVAAIRSARQSDPTQTAAGRSARTAKSANRVRREAGTQTRCRVRQSDPRTDGSAAEWGWRWRLPEDHCIGHIQIECQ